MPLLRDSINSLSMVRHCMDVIIKVINQVHPSQVPLITADQPVYALGKRIQRMYPEQYGEAKIIMSMGCLHIEMAYLSAIGDWLGGSGWDALIVEAGISTTGRAESFLSGSGVKRSRYAHIVSCAALHLLLVESHGNSDSTCVFDQWILTMKELKDLHPMGREEYAKGHFTFNKTRLTRHMDRIINLLR